MKGETRAETGKGRSILSQATDLKPIRLLIIPQNKMVMKEMPWWEIVH